MKQRRKLEWDLSYLKNFFVQVGVHQGSVLSFAITVDVITENEREEMINKNLYADDLV